MIDLISPAILDAIMVLLGVVIAFAIPIIGHYVGARERRERLVAFDLAEKQRTSWPAAKKPLQTPKRRTVSIPPHGPAHGTFVD